MIINRTQLAVSVFVVVSAVSAQGQSFGGFIKDRLKDRAKQKIAECIATDLECIRKAQEEGKEVKVTEPAAEPEATAASEPAAASPTTPAAAASATASLKPGEGAWVNYDFKPGDRRC